MTLNKGYLTSDTTSSGDEQMTPRYAVLPIIKYLRPNSLVWCPFDTKDSEFVKVLLENDFRVIFTHKDDVDNKGDFFKQHYYKDVDYIISNPPFSIKDQVLEKLDYLDIPFMILLPLNSLQGQKRYKFLEKGIQLLAFDKRINFIKDGELRKGSPFASAYFCKGVLPKSLILEELEKGSD